MCDIERTLHDLHSFSRFALPLCMERSLYNAQNTLSLLCFGLTHDCSQAGVLVRVLQAVSELDVSTCG